MKVVFFFDRQSDQPLAELAAASAKRCMPQVPTVQLCVRGMSAARHMDEVVYVEDAARPLHRRRWNGYAQFDGEVLFADTDCLFMADVSGVFSHPFALAVPLIDDPNWHFSGGVVFSRSREFWRRLAGCAVFDRPADPMLEETLATINAAIEFTDPHLRHLAHQVYERLPRSTDDACAGAALVHFRGPRKRWMERWAGATS